MEDTSYKSYFTTVCSAPLRLNSFQLACNSYMQMNRDFFMRIFGNTLKAKELLVVHPGTDILLPCAVACAAFMSLYRGEVNVREHYKQFNDDEIVIRGRERYRFGGIKGDYCILKSDDNDATRNSTVQIPLERGLNIRPYSGTSLRTGTQGSGRSLKNASDYLQRLVGNEYRSQAIVQPLCTLVVCHRDKAKSIVDGMTFEDDAFDCRFADAFHIARANSVGESEFYFGKVGKSDPTILFTNRISLAREILYDDDDYKKRIFAVIIDNVESAESIPEINDIKELMSYRQHGRIIMLESDDRIFEQIDGVISDTTQTVLWSSEVLLSTIDDLWHHPANPYDQATMDAIHRTIDSSIQRNVTKSPDAFLEIRRCKKWLKKIIHLRPRPSYLNEFVICAYGLINLFEQASFTMDEYERYIELDIHSPSQQLDKLSLLANSLPSEGYKEEAQLVATSLENVYKSMSTHNCKRDELIRHLQAICDERKTCSVIVPRQRYVSVISKVCSSFPHVKVVPYSHLSQEAGVDYLIITATPSLKRGGVNPFAAKAASNTILLEYEDEAVKNNCYQRLYERAFTAINQAAKRSASVMFGDAVDVSTFTTGDQVCQRDLDEAETFEEEITNIETDLIVGGTLSAPYPSSTTMRAIRFTQFDTGEWAFFSQNYKAYVFDSNEEKLIERHSADLQSNDVAIFPARGSEITDFVDEILNRLVLRGNNNALSEHFERSRHWKRVLSEHMLLKKLTCQDISSAMDELGHPRHAVTIATWLREDSIIVGPRDEAAFIAIGLVANNSEIADNAKTYKESCDFIRSQRMKILDYVQKSIIQSVAKTKKRDEKDSLSDEDSSYLGDVQKYARKLTIERIYTCERDVPSHFINRPFGG
mgnify:FL=1